MTTIWLIGSSPHESATGPIPLRPRGERSSTADRLRLMLDLSIDEYEAAFERANILATPPWTSRRARAAGRRVRASITEPAVVLGRDAWTAMGLPSTTMYFETVENFTLVPHPSGKSLIYNDPSMRAKLRETIDALRNRSVEANAELRAGSR